jgi:hypothetical protein
LPISRSFCNAWRKRASTPWFLRQEIFQLISWAPPSSHRWQAEPILSGGCWDNTVFPHFPSRRVSPLTCSTESAIPRLQMVRAWSGPFRQDFRSGSCSLEGLSPSRHSFASLRRMRLQQNTAFRRRTSDRFQNHRPRRLRPETEVELRANCRALRGGWTIAHTRSIRAMITRSSGSNSRRIS